MNYPKSEQTIIKHKYEYKSVKYINDIGKPCLYRVIENNKDTLERVQYYGGDYFKFIVSQREIFKPCWSGFTAGLWRA